MNENICEAVERWLHANDTAQSIQSLTGKNDETPGAS